MAAMMSSCYTTQHVVGNGASTGQAVSKKQWYILFGLVPLNEVDSKQMAGGATDYTITTKFKFVDHVIAIFTSIVTVRPMTITVEK